jgi:hypothetical protein
MARISFVRKKVFVITAASRPPELRKCPISGNDLGRFFPDGRKARYARANPPRSLAQPPGGRDFRRKSGTRRIGRRLELGWRAQH